MLRLERSKPAATSDSAAGLCRDLEASGVFCRDQGIGRVFHPGAISYRETVAENALHVVVRGDRVSAHIDRVSPVRFTHEGAARYSVGRVAGHNLAGMAEDTLRVLGGRRPKSRCEPACEWVEVDDELMARLLQPDGEGDELAAAALDNLRRELAGGTAAGVRQVPFNVVDEVVSLLDRDAEPWSVQLETRVGGRLDEARLRAAIDEALRRHPMARVRQAASRRSSNPGYWEIYSDLDVDPLRTIECPDDVAVAAAREELQGTSVPLSESPPLRVWLVRTADGDVVMLNANHAAMDGFGALRVLQSIARAYTGEPDPVPDFGFLAERSLTARLSGARVSTRMRRQLALAERLRDLVAGPARIAREHGRDEPGYGFHHVRLGREETQGLVGLDHAGSVNDVLLAALHRAVGAWNERHGVPCRRISVLVPASLRPPWREDMVGNFSLPARVSTNRAQRTTPAMTLAAVTAQTRRKKRSGLGTAFLEILSRSWLLPLRVKKALVDRLDDVGDRLVDTAILSNLGHVEDPPSFGVEGDDDPGELWFSAPARMPLGLSVGAVTVGGRLHLVFRYRHPQFGEDAARRFVDCYLTQLRQVADSVSA